MGVNWFIVVVLLVTLGVSIITALKAVSLKHEIVELKGIKKETLTLLKVIREWVNRVQDIRMVTEQKIDQAAAKATTLARAVQQVPAKVVEQIKQQAATDSEHGNGNGGLPVVKLG